MLEAERWSLTYLHGRLCAHWGTAQSPSCLLLPSLGRHVDHTCHILPSLGRHTDHTCHILPSFGRHVDHTCQPGPTVLYINRLICQQTPFAPRHQGQAPQYTQTHACTHRTGEKIYCRVIYIWFRVCMFYILYIVS